MNHERSGGRPTRSGDEPPIRVKSGSLFLHLISDSLTWEDMGGSTDFQVSNRPNRAKDALDVFIDYKTGDPVLTHGDKLEIRYSDGLVLEIKSHSRHIKVHQKNHGKVALKANGQAIDYITSGAIDSVILDKHTYLPAPDGRELGMLLILDL